MCDLIFFFLKKENFFTFVSIIFTALQGMCVRLFFLGGGWGGVGVLPLYIFSDILFNLSIAPVALLNIVIKNRSTYEDIKTM